MLMVSVSVINHSRSSRHDLEDGENQAYVALWIDFRMTATDVHEQTHVTQMSFEID